MRASFFYCSFLLVALLAGCASREPRVYEEGTSMALQAEALALRPAIDEAAEPCSSAEPETGRFTDEMLDETRVILQDTVCTAALWFDGLFGEQGARQKKAARGAYGRAELSMTHSDFHGNDVRLRFNARVELTNIKERLNAFVGRDSEDTLVRDRAEGFALRTRFPQFEDREETIAGLGYSLPDNYVVKTEFRTGLRFSGLQEPRLFAQTRLAANAYADDSNLLNFRLTLFINTVDGLGQTTTMDFSHVISERLLLRWNTTGTMTQETDGLDWRNALILYRSLSKKRAVAYEAYIRGLSKAPEPLQEYGLQVIFRQPILRERLFVNPVLTYSWPRTNPELKREGDFAFALILELPFGHRATATEHLAAPAPGP